MKARIPVLLIGSRLVLGLAMIVLSLARVRYYPVLAVTLLTVGLLTDIFDGIIARRLNISTQKLRRLDSTVDQIFFLSAGVATYVQHPGFFTAHAYSLALLLGLEALTYVVSFIKFRKEIATHSIGAKLWTLLLVATLIQVILQGQSTVLFAVCFWAGILTRLEILLIILTLKYWTNDVPTWYHAIRLSKGKEIRRHRMFNG